MSDEYQKTVALHRPAGGGPAASETGNLYCLDKDMLGDPAGAMIRLAGNEVTVGRGSDNSVSLDAMGISRHHARLFRNDGNWWVKDLGSTNGTRVNSSLVEQRVLTDGDTVSFGRVRYAFRLDPPETGGSTTIDLDLGSNMRTLVMRPGQSQAPAQDLDEATETAAVSVPPAPGAEQIYESGRRTRPAAPPAPPRRTAAPSRRASPPSSGGTSLPRIVAVVIALAAAAAGAAYILGLI